jgi:glycosyltransferase involved in cell wall biosynthesis
MIKNNNPLVSIVTPSYNHGLFIEETLLSVKNQDYPYIEHIVIDGGSKDNTVKILRRYASEYNMRWISEVDDGQSEAINNGFRMTKGLIVGWLNSDDVFFDRSVITYIVEQFRRFPELDVIFGNDVLIDAESTILRVRRIFDWNYDRLLRGFCISQPATFLKGDIARENDLDQRLQYAMDLELWLRLGKNCKFRHVNKILAGNRIYRTTKTISGTVDMIREVRQITRLYGQTFGLSYHLFKYLVDLPGFIVRRMAEIPRILRIEKEFNRLAFKAKCKGKIRRAFSQMWISLLDLRMMKLLKP